MQTREERAKALADKQAKENKQVEQMREVLKSFLSDFRTSVVKLEHSYKITDHVALNDLKKALREVEIPKEVVVNHSTDIVTHKFLWYYFAVSTFVMFLCVGGGVYAYRSKEDAVKDAKNEYFDRGIEEGTKRVYKVLPNTNKKYLKTKFPNVKFE